MERIDRSKRLKYVAKVGVLSAIAFILMFFEVPLWFAPPFYKLDFSEVPILIGSFALGPVSGVLMELVKILLHLIFKGTSTAFVGEVANFVIGCAFVLPASLLYKHHKSLKNAILGMVLGAVSLALAGALMNYFVLIPAYSNFYHLPLETILEMAHAANASVNDLKQLILFAVVPFNLLKAAVVSVITLLVYKRVSGVLHI